VRVADVGEDDLVTPTTWLEIREQKPDSEAVSPLPCPQGLD
jgi:hypothetical protein